MDVYIFKNTDFSLSVFGNEFKINKEIFFSVDDIIYTIPKGMTTDFGSVPIPFRNIFSRYGINTIPYIIHDFGYREQPEGTNRKFWDNVLLELLKKNSFNFKNDLIYYGLRMFGGLSWNKNKKKLKRGSF